jgi:hypothetical protein
MTIMLHCPLALHNSQAAAVAADVASVHAQEELTAQRKRKREADDTASSYRQVGPVAIALSPQAGTLRPRAPANDPPLTAAVVAAIAMGNAGGIPARGSHKNYVSAFALRVLQQEGLQWYIKRCCYETRHYPVPWTPQSFTPAMWRAKFDSDGFRM